jgi:hypothetical protein
MSENEDQYIKTGFSLIDNDAFLLNNRSRYVMYLLMRRFAVRKSFNGDLNLHKNYWKNGYIAASKPTSFLARKMGYKSDSTVRKWIKELVENKMIVLSETHTNPGKPQNVFILGIHNAGEGKEYKEYFYIDWPELIDEFGVSGMVDFYKLLRKGGSNR